MLRNLLIASTVLVQVHGAYAGEAPEVVGIPVRMAPEGPTPDDRIHQEDGSALVFTLTLNRSASRFSAEGDFKQHLLESAQAAERIEIRGRTDANHASAANRELARARAMDAYRFLVSQGVAPSKIRVVSRGAGAHAVDNSTPAGRDRNRRVEVVTFPAAS